MPRKKSRSKPLVKRSLRKNFIFEWRKLRGMTQEELAFQVEELSGEGCTGSTLSRIERSVAIYKQRQLEALADILKCSQGDLLERHPMAEQPSPIIDGLDFEDRRRVMEYIRFVRSTPTSTSTTD